MYDTGIDGLTGTRFRAIRAEIIAGDLKPDIASIKKKWKCGQETARKYLNALVEQQVLVFTGYKYKLNTDIKEDTTDD